MLKRLKTEGNRPSTIRLHVDGRGYSVHVIRRVIAPPEAPRLVVIGYQPNQVAKRLLEVCIRSIQQNTPEPHELWVVDNNSPRTNIDWLFSWPGLNLALNRTEPIPPEQRGWLKRIKGNANQRKWGSYANAIGLELAVRLIDQQSAYLMTLHMDTMACRAGWLSFLISKTSGDIAAAGVRMDRNRSPAGVLHVLGCLFRLQLLRALDLDFLPRLPQYDVGDRVSVGIREAGYRVFACRNTIWEPRLVETIPLGSSLRNLAVDRAFDDQGNVIFLHLGRGTRKSAGEENKGVTPEEWIKFALDEVLA